MKSNEDQRVTKFQSTKVTIIVTNFKKSEHKRTIASQHQGTFLATKPPEQVVI